MSLEDRRAAFLTRIRDGARASAARAEAGVGEASGDAGSIGPPAAFLPATIVGPPRRDRRLRRGRSLAAAATRDLASRCGTDPAWVVVAALAAVLARYLAQSSLVIAIRGGPGSRGTMQGAVRMLHLEVDRDNDLGTLARDVVRRIAAARPVPPGLPTPIVVALGDDDPLLPWPRAWWPECDLLIEVSVGAGAIAAEFDQARHEAAVVDAFIEHIDAVLAAGASEPGQPVAELRTLTASQVSAVVDRPNATSRTVGGGTVMQAIGRACERDRDAPALADAAGEMTYGQLASATRSLAGRLRALGVGPEDRVAIMISRGDLRWVVACLGILAAGGTIVPLDPDLPAARAAALLDQVGAVAVVTDGRLRVGLDGRSRHIVDAGERTSPAGDRGPRRAGGQGTEQDTRWPTARQAAYCVFTSGSTGTPNAVIVEHASLLNFSVSFSRLLGLRPADRVLQYASPGFDVAMQEIFPTLLSGACLVIAGQQERLSADALAAAMRRSRITVAEIPPVVMALMDPAAIPDLRIASVGGEAFDGSLVARWSPYCRVINGYGPAEATIGVIYKDCTGDLRSVPPIGLPVDNQRGYVLDEDLRPVPFGAVGELCLAGAGLARGYLGNPALTAVRFAPNPFSPAGERLLRTGDLARFNADGDLIFVGRKDRQVKVRGQRVELGEVEAALTGLGGVRGAVVDAAPARRADDQVALVGYLIASGERELDLAALRAELATRLPAYLVPSRLVQIAEIPVNSNGKVDLEALRRTGADAAGPAAVAGRVLSPAQLATYRRCVAPVLPAAPPDADADFFQAGASSLDVMRLIARVRQLLAVEITVADLLRMPTLANLTDLIIAAERSSGPDPRGLADRRPGAGSGPYPLTPSQRGIWFTDRLVPGQAAYNLIEAYRAAGELDAGALGRALLAVVRRHGGLRSRIVIRDGLPCAIADPGPASYAPACYDLTGSPAGPVSDLLARLLAQPFDLAAEHPFRVALIRLGPRDHILAMVMHHVVSDGRSTEVILAELSELYRAEREGADADLRPAAQPAEFAAWQQARAGDRDLRYWREQLAGSPADAELPADRRRPAEPSFAGATLHFELPAATGALVAELGRTTGATPFMTLLTGFVAVLARYSVSKDVVVGTPVSSRMLAEFDHLVTFAAAMVVLRTRCHDDPPFRDLVARIRATALAAYSHADLAFDRLVAELDPGRDLRRNPLFQVTFQAYDAPEDFLSLPGCQITKVVVPESSSRFDLSLAIQIHRSGHLEGSLNYCTDLFDRDTAQRLIDHYRTLLGAALAEPDRRLSELTMLTPAECAESLASSRGPEVTTGATVVHLIEQQTARAPSAVAVTCGSQRLTYAQLDEAARRLARQLAARGARRGDVVAVCLDRGPALVVALLGVLKAGAAYLPIDPVTPARRVAFMIAETGARLAISSDEVAALLPPATSRIRPGWLPGEDGDQETAPASGQTECAVAGADDLAYVAYTSGSTGQPKGVGVPHRAVARLVRGLPLRGLTAADTFLQLAPAAFDASTFEIWTPLTIGARLAIYPPGPVGPVELGEMLRREQVTVAWLTAQFTNLVVNVDPGLLGTLTTLVTGGEALSVPHIAGLLRRLPDLAVYNGYGPTETTTFAVMHRVAAGHLDGAASVPIGRPIGGTQAHVLDRDLNPLPAGATGELYIGGAGLARGYLCRPGHTADLFRPDPFGPAGSRMYRTGDVVRRLRSGELVFLGRADDQVKLRGFRIEPGEVAAVLAGHPQVRNAFVTTRGGGLGTELVAYVQARDGCDSEALAGYLRDRLPYYMVPSAIVAVDALPLSPNGKVDRHALPDPRRAPAAPARAAPAPGLASAVAQTWAQVLGRDRIEADDNFFRLGGNSLQASEVSTRLADRLGRPLPLTLLFRYPTVAGLATALGEAASGDQPEPGPPVLAAGRAAPLAPGQRGLWILEQLYPGKAAYNIAYGIRLKGELDGQALNAALQRIVARHAPLRTRFVLGDDGWPIQADMADAEQALMIDYRSENNLRGALDRMSEDAARPFDLSAGPLIRFRLARLAPDDHLLGVVVHHAAFDGASLGVLLGELAIGYRAHSGAVAAELPELTLHYDEYAREQRSAAATGVHGDDLAYWRQKLAGAPSTTWPADSPRPKRRSAAGQRTEFRLLPARKTPGIGNLARACDTTTSTVLLAAFAACLAVRTGVTDLVIGYPLAGRDRPGSQHLIGYFVNTVVLRLDFSGDPAFTELVGRTRDTLAEAIAHQNLPFESLVAALNPRRDPSRTPLFQVIFSVQDNRSAEFSLPGLRSEIIEIHNGTSKFDLDVSVQWHATSIDGIIEYSTDIFGASTIGRFTDNYRRVLGAALADARTPLSVLSQRS